jgi:hypothetical protein
MMSRRQIQGTLDPTLGLLILLEQVILVHGYVQVSSDSGVSSA